MIRKSIKLDNITIHLRDARQNGGDAELQYSENSLSEAAGVPILDGRVFKVKSKEEISKALDEMVRINQELGLYD